MNNLSKAFYVFLISMVPVVELRGAIPVGFAAGLPWYWSFIPAVIGNLLPVPFILLFICRIVSWLERKGYMKWATDFLERKVRKNAHKVQKYTTWGLMLFVAIPLPGTGAWTGALIAAFLGIEMKKALPTIAAGVVCAGLIMSVAIYGAVGFLKFLL